VPVHADIPAINAILLAELDDRSNPLKSKGIGELGICGAGASIANVIHNACGARIPDFPITLDKLLSSLPVRALAAQNRRAADADCKWWQSGHTARLPMSVKCGGSGHRQIGLTGPFRATPEVG
jgi:hypothetical protein